MPEKDPTTYAWITYFWVFFLSGWGGVVSFFKKVKDGTARACNFTELLGEICTASFAGIITFYFCEAGGFNPLLTAAFTGISGHMGSRAIFALERTFESRFNPGYIPPAPTEQKEEHDDTKER